MSRDPLEEIERRNIRLANGLFIAKHNLAGLAIGIVMGAILGVLSAYSAFQKLTLTQATLAGIGFTVLVSILLLPLVQLKAGILVRREKIEYVMTALIASVVAWPVVYAAIVGPS
jgi:uncharacterized membrane protein YagU involved in acid resistance